MKKLLSILLLLILISCDSNPVAPVVSISITMNNRVMVVLSLYQNDALLTEVLPRSEKVLTCVAGTIEAKPGDLASIFFTARNNKTYTYNSGKITESGD